MSKHLLDLVVNRNFQNLVTNSKCSDLKFHKVGLKLKLSSFSTSTVAKVDSNSNSDDKPEDSTSGNKLLRKTEKTKTFQARQLQRFLKKKLQEQVKVSDISDKETPSKQQKRPNPRSIEVLNYIKKYLPSAYFNENPGTSSDLNNSPISISTFTPQKSLKFGPVSRIPSTTYLINNSVAEQIAEVIKDLILKEEIDLTSPAIEIAPGIGLLTRQLINLGFRNLACLEEQLKYIKFLEKSLNSEFNNSRVVLLSKGFSEFPRIHHIDKLDGGNRVNQLLSQVNIESPGKKPLLVFGSIPHISLINFAIKSLITQKVLYEEDSGWLDPVYYVALGPKAHWVLSSSPESGSFPYRSSTILFQLLFKCTVLKELEQKAWVPWVAVDKEKRGSRYWMINKFNPEVAYLVKIQTNFEVLKELGVEEGDKSRESKLVPFWYFVRQHLFSRGNFVIQELEQWIPGCGARLVRKGFTVYSKFGELTPPQILALYKEFVSWPEFRGSSFATAVDKFMIRLDVDSREDEH